MTRWIPIYQAGDYPEIATHFDFQWRDIESTGQDPDDFYVVGLVQADPDELIGTDPYKVTLKETSFLYIPLSDLELK